MSAPVSMALLFALATGSLGQFHRFGFQQFVEGLLYSASHKFLEFSLDCFLVTGWGGYKKEILVFGYSVDGEAVFNSYVKEASSAVINAGGENAKRFSTNVNIGELSIGTHTVDLLVLLEDGTVAKMLSFELTIIEEPEEDSGGSSTDTDSEILELNDSSVGYKSKSFDIFKIDGNDYFASNINSNLAAGKTIEVETSANQIYLYGWIGFTNQIKDFGYRIDGGEASYEIEPIVPESGSGVYTAGGEYARRFGITINISKLFVGEHTIDILVRVETDGIVTVKMLSLKLVVAGYESLTDLGYKVSSFDNFKVDGADIFTVGKVQSELVAAGNTVTVTSSANQIYLYGWIGFTNQIEDFGHRIDGGEASYGINPIVPASGSGVYTVGGEYARRFGITMNISDLDKGEHTVDLLVRVKVDDGNVPAKMLSFKLVIE